MAKEIICGVYEIKNEINGLFYIGSSKDIYNRWARHKAELKRNAHRNYLLQNDWNQYGEESFTFNIVERCSLEE